MPVRMVVYSPLFCVDAGRVWHTLLAGMPQ